MAIQADEEGAPREGQRIAKAMARAGLCSRRDAEQWIAEGRVSVNGEILASPAFNVSDADDVRVDGEPLRAPDRTRLFLFHKPRGLVTTAKDPEGRSTIFDALPADLPRVVAVGRLDINTEGLLLLTNDGGLSRVLELPATGWLRRYRVRAHGEITQAQLDGLSDGVSIDGINYLGIEARFERQQGSNVWLTMGLREGKNREIKRVLEHMGLSVNRLIRVSFGPFELGDLAERDVVEVRTRVLRDQLGPKLARQAGANFEAPAEAPELAWPEPRVTRDEPPLRPRAELPGRGPLRDPAPRKRKHVSVLRAEARAETAGPRKRIARATTADRKGREVKVERVSLARPVVAETPRRAERYGERRGASRGPKPLGGEGFDGRSARSRGGARESVEERRPRDDARATRRDDRPPPRRGAGGAEFGGRKFHDGPPRRPRAMAPEGERRPREGAPPRRDDRSPRTDRGDGGRPGKFHDGPSRRPRAAAAEGERRPREGAPPRRDDRSPRTDRGGRPGPAPARDRPERPAAAKTFRDDKRPRAASAPRADRKPRRDGAKGFDARPRAGGGPPRGGAKPPRGGGKGPRGK